MEPLHLVHLGLLCAWAGLVACESVIELSARDASSLRIAAAMHFKIDAYVELPLLLAVLGSGLWLVFRVWPLGLLHWLKVACGLGAVAANLFCVVHVIRRHAMKDDQEALRWHTRRIFASAVAGVPMAVVAAYLGLMFFRR